MIIFAVLFSEIGPIGASKCCILAIIAIVPLLLVMLYKNLKLSPSLNFLMFDTFQ